MIGGGKRGLLGCARVRSGWGARVEDPSNERLATVLVRVRWKQQWTVCAVESEWDAQRTNQDDADSDDGLADGASSEYGTCRFEPHRLAAEHERHDQGAETRILSALRCPFHWQLTEYEQVRYRLVRGM